MSPFKHLRRKTYQLIKKLSIKLDLTYRLKGANNSGADCRYNVSKWRLAFKGRKHEGKMFLNNNCMAKC